MSMIPTKEVAKLLGVTPRAVNGYRKDGRLSGEKKGTTFYFSKETIASYLRTIKESGGVQAIAPVSQLAEKSTEEQSAPDKTEAEVPQKPKRAPRKKKSAKTPAPKGFAPLKKFERRAAVQTKDFGTSEFWNENACSISKSLPKSVLGGAEDKMPNIPRSFAQSLGESTTLDLEEALQNLHVEKAMDYVQEGCKADQIRLRPKAYIRRIWKRWFEIANKVYNLCIEKIMGTRWHRKRTPEAERKRSIKKCEFSEGELRALITKRLGAEIKECNAPDTIKDHAMEQAIQASKSKGVKQMKRRENPTTIQVRGEYIKHGHLFFGNTQKELHKELLKKNPKAKFSHAGLLLKSEPNPALKKEALQKYANLNKGKVPLCYLTPKYGLKKYFLCISYPVTPTTKTKGVIALDPGIRTFLTYYDGKTAGDLGKEVCRDLDRLERPESEMKEKLKTLPWKKRSNIRRALNRLKERRRNLVEELHKKAVNFLCNYRYILLPRYSTNWMLPEIRRSGGKLNFFKFKLRLITKASQRGSTVILCNEAHTSKTCSVCGTMKDVGSSKVYECTSCSYRADRDYNAAQNVLIRSLRDSVSPIPRREPRKKQVSTAISK